MIELKSFFLLLCLLVNMILIREELFSQNNSEKHSNSVNHEVSFITNNGQVVDQFGKKRSDILYFGETNGLTFYIKNNGYSLQQYRVLEGISTSDSLAVYRTDINWIGANIEWNKTIGISSLG